MLYELIAVVRPGNLLEVKEIARTAGALILRNGGTIRGIKNWGVWSLPKKTRKHQAQYTDGHYWIMRYDASVSCSKEVRMTLGLDPRMIKFSTVKLGDGTLSSLSKLGGDIIWREGRAH
ncbi:37S ribosomal protein-like protein Mrp17 [Mollisia scopiformis]|uniref:Small ribosomal subunit protein bS6m n=1 Tax=Mollisia scopiformis TaxID=149040 RepID=A0A194XQP5_MOLSC|nr:37S ribosomal protein-like protein Mrp17 [Mollisia scopiformis]KUJ22042.1 37S ribosomal protein-like protein Mrp17 [Mollisia scopiformis]